MPPRRTSFFAWPVRGTHHPSCLPLSLGLSDCPTESTWVPSNCLPACLATVEHNGQNRDRYRPSTALVWGATCTTIVFGIVAWCPTTAGRAASSTAGHGVSLLVAIRAGPRGTLSLPCCPCDDRSFLTPAPALWEHHR